MNKNVTTKKVYLKYYGCRTSFYDMMLMGLVNAITD